MHSVVRLVIMLIVTAAPAVGGATAASADTSQLQMVNADGYYSPGGNGVTWPLGPSTFGL